MLQIEQGIQQWWILLWPLNLLLSLLDLGLLSIFGMLFFSGGFVAFLNYDPR